MKLIHKILLVILALMLALTFWFHYGAKLRGRATVTTAVASDYPDAFTAAASIVRSGAAHQTFSDASLDGSAGYELVDASVDLKNYGLFAAEWLEITVNPAAEDVAVYSTSGGASDVPAFGSGRINVKLVTRNAQASRSVTINYYVYGIYESITVPLR